MVGVMLFGLHLIRWLSLKKLRRDAKRIMSRLLAAGGLRLKEVIRVFRSLSLDLFSSVVFNRILLSEMMVFGWIGCEMVSLP